MHVRSEHRYSSIIASTGIYLVQQYLVPYLALVSYPVLQALKSCGVWCVGYNITCQISIIQQKEQEGV